jgi:hypothetical protein
MVVTKFDMLIDLRAVQQIRKLFSIFFIPLAIVIDRSDLQYDKNSFPIEVTVSGMMIDVRA